MQPSLESVYLNSEYALRAAANTADLIRAMNVLLSSAGRRVSLLRLFPEALQRSQISGQVIAADASERAPAAYFADRFVKVPRCTEADFIPQVLEICLSRAE